MNKVTNVCEDEKAINNLRFLCKIVEDRLRAKVFRHLSKGKNIANIQCYEHYGKDCPKFKGNKKANREEKH